jgi:hypothetical protein
MGQHRRVKLLRLSVTMLPCLFRDGARWTLIAHPLPSDARVTRWYLDGPCQDLAIVVASESYPEVADGQPIPELDAVMFRESDTEVKFPGNSTDGQA